MTGPEQFTSILEQERENELVPFLKALSPDQKNELTPPLKKLFKEYFEYREVKEGQYSSYRIKATPQQVNILHLTAFVCFTRKEFEKEVRWGSIVTEPIMREVLNWYCPDWYTDYLNSFGTAENMPYSWTYEWMMEQADEGFITPRPELIVRLLPMAVFRSNNDKKHTWTFTPEILLKRKISLEQHLWYIFEYESSINWTNNSVIFGQQATPRAAGWIEVLKIFSTEGKIDRNRLLKEALLATTRNFNKTLSGWFAELFIQLEPSKEEILSLQNELFIAFNSPHSKPVNTALTCLKKVAEEKAFNTTLFLDQASLLLSSETKSVVVTTLQILEIVAKMHPDQGEEISIAACQAFLQKDDSVKTRAAKLIAKYSTPSDAALVQALAQYTDSLLVSAKGLLGAFFSEEGTGISEETHSFEATHLPVFISPEREIPRIANLDELLFLLSQAFDNNETYHLDWVLAALIQFQQEVKGATIAKLEPAFQRAYKLLLQGMQGANGNLDHLLATFFVEYAKLLIKEFPSDAQSLKQLHEKNVKKDEERKGQWNYCKLKSAGVAQWEVYSKHGIYQPFKQLVLATLAKLKDKTTLPLLSTPTHTPAWIDPLVLVDRLRQYQSAEALPNTMDLQIALSRCVLENKGAVLEAAKRDLTSEYRNLIQFLFDEDAQPTEPYQLESAWVITALTKHPEKRYPEIDALSAQKISRNCLTGQFAWNTLVEESYYDNYDYDLKKTVKTLVSHKMLRLELENQKKSQPEPEEAPSTQANANQEKDVLLYEFITMEAYYPHLVQHDIKRLLLLIPHNPEPILALITQHSLSYSNFYSEETYKKTVIYALEVLIENWRKWGEMAHLFIATCMLSNDTTVRTFAAEIWMNGVSTATIESKLLGEIIGKHERIEFAPLKRFTDLVSSTMLGVSNQHNRELEDLFISILQQLALEPITNLKKLLEVYQEVLSVTKSSISDAKVIDQLKSWQSSASLHKVIKSLQGKIK